MEISTSVPFRQWVRICICVLLLACWEAAPAQDHKAYKIRDGRMYIEISKKIRESELDSFIIQFDLSDLPLKYFLRTQHPDSLVKLGWNINVNNEVGFVISKALGASENIFDLGGKIDFEERRPSFPAVNNGVVLGWNRFRNKSAFAVSDSLVYFFIRNQQKATRVHLAGSFNDWSPESLPMKKTDSGWIAAVKLGPGKYWYKFIVDGNWTTDTDNYLQENDGEGNTNSVYFRPNMVFHLEGASAAKAVSIAGSFNNWKSKELLMERTATGWRLPVYLAEGTHAYKFVVDGNWQADPANPDKLPDGTGSFNSVLKIGEAHLFKLKGYTNARRVLLAGSFNSWRDFELEMRKTDQGWELPYTIGPGNYEYKFIVDGHWISDPDNPMTAGEASNSFITIQPNYTFRLKGYPRASKVYLAGDFNDWKPGQLAMQKQGEDWIFSIHLATGKVRYKFVVDGNWIIDPGNKLWEQNEYGTGNSILWVER